MQEPVATMEPERDHLKETTAVPVPQQRGGGGMKFAYPSGSRPLEGFTIKRGVGIGGFGEVYFATSDAGKEVALKHVRRNMDVELRGVRQCLNLKHQNLISLFDIRYDDEGGAWVVMEYVSGESLKDAIDRNPRGMPLEEVQAWFRGVVAGVACLHDHGIVHRDLKPGNIFIDDDIVKIGDYGLSKFISCSRRSGQTESVGTFHYMAPEIGKGVYGKEIDIYALGIILCEMLTGRAPFEGETSQEIMMKHLTADPDLTGIAEPYRAVIQRALRKDPRQRFSSVGEMLRHFDGQVDPQSELEIGSDADLEFDEVEVVAAEPVPPVVNPGAVPSPNGQTLYIADDEPSDIVFGEVKQRPPKNDPPTPPRTRLNAVPVAARGEEPVARAVRDSVQGGYRWWQHSGLSGPLKVLLVCGAVFVILLNSEWLLPLAVFAGAAYLVYFGIRSLVLTLNAPRSATPAHAAHVQTVPARSATATPAAANVNAVANVPARPRYRPTNLDQRVRQVLHQKPSQDRVTELTGSLLMSVLVSAVLCLILMLLGGKPLDASVDTWTFYGWMVLSSVAGAWTILGISKFWEGSTGDSVLRRFVMLVAGMAVGAAAYFGNQLLMVDFSDAPSLTLPVALHPPDQLTSSIYAADGTPLLPAYMIYFGGLFLILRWWRQVDPLRKTRLSFWGTAGCALWAWILNMFWQFPQPWGFMLAMTIAISVQLAAPWIGVEQRERLAQRYREA